MEPEKLRILFEAARWAPSSYNEQPWRFLVATQDEPEWLARLQSYLSPGNAWALQAPVLIASAYSTQFNRNKQSNRVAFRDLGAAEENLFLQACDLGLIMHQMAGFDHERLKRELLPDGFEPGVMSAIGYPANPEEIPTEVRERPRQPRTRRLLPQFVFGPRWGEPASFLR